MNHWFHSNEDDHCFIWTFPKIDLDVRFLDVSKDWFRHQLGGMFPKIVLVRILVMYKANFDFMISK